MLDLDDAMRIQSAAATHKVHGAAAPARFTVSGMLAGAYVGVAVVLMLSTAGPLLAAGAPTVKLVSGLVFGVALTLVVFAGGELSTSSMMTLTQGVFMRAVRPGRAAGVLVWTFAANLAGAVVFGGIVTLSGVLRANAAAGTMLTSMLQAKAEETPVEMFFRAVLCNTLVCLAIWMCARLTSDGAKLGVIFWALLAFIASGFEHVVANMTTYSLGLFAGVPDATIGLFARNLLWVGTGNLVGGALFVGIAYWFVAGSPRAAAGRGDAAAVPAVAAVAAVPAVPALPAQQLDPEAPSAAAEI